jgi:isopentenyl-diphosphate delta-isomerase
VPAGFAMEYVILVDKKDRQTGIEEKLKAHQEAKLHRAVSIFVMNDDDQLLIQQRANEKYHCPGLWSNTCCSHPMPGESTENAAHRRLKEEMGFDCGLEYNGAFIYKFPLTNDLTEFEFDHVFFGKYNGIVTPSPSEVAAFEWKTVAEICYDIIGDSGKYTPWFKMLLSEMF